MLKLAIYLPEVTELAMDVIMTPARAGEPRPDFEPALDSLDAWSGR